MSKDPNQPVDIVAVNYSDSYYVDIPTMETIKDGPEGAWTNVGTFSSKSEAIEWIRDNIGYCDDEGRICLLTHMENDEND